MKKFWFPLMTRAAMGIACCGCQKAKSSSAGQEQLRPAAKAYLNMPSNEPGDMPELLSQTGAFLDTRELRTPPALTPYELNVPFWADGADKRRWIALPSGSSIGFSPTGEWTFPDGTVFIKHFELNQRRLETRLLVRSAGGGVYGMSFRWNEDQSDALAVRQGVTKAIELKSGGKRTIQSWYFPGPDDCRKCHLPVAGGVLGVNTRQLNRPCPGSGKNQLVAWSRMNLLNRTIRDDEVASFSKLPALEPGSANSEQLARAYLDVNCGYCHRPGGAAADFDARYETPLAKQSLINAPARINLGIDHARQIAPNDPWRSMVLVRLITPEQTRMPPLGPMQTDARGAKLVSEWIASLPAPPVAPPPSITPRGLDFKDHVRVTITHSDPGTEIRYTLDGNPPGKTSALYHQPLQFANSTTVRARAFKAGHGHSIVVQETFIHRD